MNSVAARFWIVIAGGALLLRPAFAADGSYRIAVIPRDGTHAYWQSVHAGVKRAERELQGSGMKLMVEWDAPAKENDVAGQIRLVNAAVARRLDGLVLAPLDRQELVAPTTEALRQKLAIVTLDSGLDLRSPVPAVASNNYEAGRMAGLGLGESLGGRGNVIMFRHHVQSENTEEREEGFLSVMHNEYPQMVVLVSDFHAGPSKAVAHRVVPTLIDRTRARLNGIFASSETAGAEALAVLRARGLAGGKVKLVGVEDEDGALRAGLAGGDVLGVVVQDPEKMGYLALKALVAQLQGKHPAAITYTGIRWEIGSGVSPLSSTLKRRDAASTFIVPELGLVMVKIPVATPSDRPFYLGKFEVTQREWRAIMGDNPSDFTGDLLPVDSVSWNMAADFCRRLNEREMSAGRLLPGYRYAVPTDAQWEYAARAGQTVPSGVKLADQAWYAGNSGSWSPPPGPASPRPAAVVWRMGTHPVGQKEPNAWGLYDMLGNVLEWCTDPAAGPDSAYESIRGGGWWTDPQVCTIASQAKAPRNRHQSALGFRLALAPQL